MASLVRSLSRASASGRWGFSSVQNVDRTRVCLSPLADFDRKYSTQNVTPGTTGDWTPNPHVSRLESTALPVVTAETKEPVRFNPGDKSKRAFTYFMLGSAKFGYASFVRLAVIKCVSTLSATADVLAAATVEVDLSKIPEGNNATIKWQGKPVFIRHRTDKEIEEANNVNLGDLRDPQTDDERTKNPKWLIVLGICTHLGCVPLSGAGDYNAYFCPCHGSHYDFSGRIRKGPAPLNLEVPHYEFMDENTVLIGKV